MCTNLTLTVNGFSKPYAMTGLAPGLCGRAGRRRPGDRFPAKPFDFKSRRPSRKRAHSRPTRDRRSASRRWWPSTPSGATLVCGLLDGIPPAQVREAAGCILRPSSIFRPRDRTRPSLPRRLLDKQKVAVVPGIAFGDDKTIRISYATSTENIQNGLKRIASFVGA